MSLVNAKGVDISCCNEDIDLSKVKKAGYNFVMIRCGYGDDLVSQDDYEFEANVKKCEALGIPWGVYLYSYALDIDDAVSEARHVLRLLKGKKPTMPIAFDMEDADGYKRKNGMPSNKMLVDICKRFLAEMKCAGYYPMLYASLSWLNNQLNDSSLLNNYDVWVAQWNSTCNYNKPYGMWQYGGETNYLESNSIPGVGVIDKNKCYKDYPTIIKNGGWNGWKKGSSSSSSSSTTPAKKETTSTKPNIYVQGVSNGKWQKVAKNGTISTGVLGKPLVGFAVKTDKGKVEYSAHVKNGGWLGKITGWNANDYKNGYAGNGNPAKNGNAIDAIKIDYYTPSDVVSKYGYLKAAYRVHVLGGKWLDWQYDTETSNGQDGYAGILGKTIDLIELKLV